MLVFWGFFTLTVQNIWQYLFRKGNGSEKEVGRPNKHIYKAKIEVSVISKPSVFWNSLILFKGQCIPFMLELKETVSSGLGGGKQSGMFPVHMIGFTLVACDRNPVF